MRYRKTFERGEFDHTIYWVSMDGGCGTGTPFYDTLEEAESAYERFDEEGVGSSSCNDCMKKLMMETPDGKWECLRKARIEISEARRRELDKPTIHIFTPEEQEDYKRMKAAFDREHEKEMKKAGPWEDRYYLHVGGVRHELLHPTTHFGIAGYPPISAQFQTVCTPTIPRESVLSMAIREYNTH